MVNQNSINTNYIVGTNQELRQPVQPAFLAHLSADALNVTGDGTNYLIVFDTEIFDQNADYNNATGQFTAPISGNYSFCYESLMGGTTAAMTDGLNTLSTTSGGDTQRIGASYVRDVNNKLSFFSICVAYLDAGDVCTGAADLLNGTKVADVLGHATQMLTYFSGYLVC